MYMSIKDLNVSQYNSKYLKYKNKYLTLKKMIGGGNKFSSPIDPNEGIKGNRSNEEDEKCAVLNIVYINSMGEETKKKVCLEIKSIVLDEIPFFIQELNEVTSDDYIDPDNEIIDFEYIDLANKITAFEANTSTKLNPKTTVGELLKLKKHYGFDGLISLIIYSNQSKALETYLSKLSSTEKDQDEQKKIQEQSPTIEQLHSGQAVLDDVKVVPSIIVRWTFEHSTFFTPIEEESLSLANIKEMIIKHVPTQRYNNLIIYDKNNRIIENDNQLLITYKESVRDTGENPIIYIILYIKSDMDFPIFLTDDGRPLL